MKLSTIRPSGMAAVTILIRLNLAYGVSLEFRSSSLVSLLFACSVNNIVLFLFV